MKTRRCGRCLAFYAAEDTLGVNACPACVALETAPKCAWCGKVIRDPKRARTGETVAGVAVVFHEIPEQPDASCFARARRQQRRAVIPDSPQRWGDADHRRPRPKH